MEERWYSKEWEWAQQRYEDETKISGKLNFKTIFVAIGDYRFSESYHQKLPSCITAASAFETAKDNIENLIRLINA